MSKYFIVILSLFLSGCGAGSSSDETTEEQEESAPDLTLDLTADLYNEITITSEDRFTYFKYSNELIFDYEYTIADGDVDDFAPEGFDPYTTTENQMIFEDSYKEFGNPIALSGTIYDYEKLIFPGGIYCPGEAGCSAFLDPDAVFSDGAIAFPYTSYSGGGGEWSSYMFNEIALNDIKDALLGNGN